MKRIIQLIALLTLSAPLSTNAQLGINGNVELGTWDGWRLYTGPNSGGSLVLSSFTEGYVAGRHAIVTPGDDDWVGAKIKRVFPNVVGPNDTFAIKIGDEIGNGNAEIVSYRIANYYLHRQGWGFSLAFIGQNGHSSAPGSNPAITMWVSKSDNLATSMNPGNLIGDTTIHIGEDKVLIGGRHYFQSVSDIQYGEWARFELKDLFFNPDLFTVDSITVYFAVSDCAPGPHWGYLYIDNLYRESRTFPGFTLASPTFPPASSGPITINGTSSVAESTYWWTIVRSNAAGDPMMGAPVFSTQTAIMPLPPPVIPGNLNLRPVFNTIVPSGYFSTEKYYRLTLVTKNTGEFSRNEKWRVIKCQ
ncbi:hypothetical protein [Taibaiella helva]|uniref:hypothetical protein n=1 Tax=Taibaiella helva TaxID=2301235 RepID=UPI0013004B89|nr:hypothetical protein [Taibaiella helva]